DGSGAGAGGYESWGYREPAGCFAAGVRADDDWRPGRGLPVRRLAELEASALTCRRSALGSGAASECPESGQIGEIRATSAFQDVVRAFFHRVFHRSCA